MNIKLIASTEAQNNFGRILDDVVQNDTRYIIRRRNISQAIILNISDLENLLTGDEKAREKLEKIIHELIPTYTIGQSLSG